jgi:hypothetical protein
MALAVALTGLGMTFWHDREIAALEDAQSNVVREAVAVSEIPRQSAPAVIP